jgi:hypothetical protein
MNINVLKEVTRLRHFFYAVFLKILLHSSAQVKLDAFISFSALFGVRPEFAV